MNLSYTENKNLLDDIDYLNISKDILYVNFQGLKISADRCELFKNAGIILYSNDKKIINSSELKPTEAILVKTDSYMHIFVKLISSPNHDKGMYLILKEKEKRPITIYPKGSLVIRSDDNTAYIVSSMYMKDVREGTSFETFEDFYNTFKEDIESEILENYHNLFYKIKSKKGNAIISIDKACTLDELKQDTEAMLKIIKKGQ